MSPWLTAAIPMENPHCSCKPTLWRPIGNQEMADAAGKDCSLCLTGELVRMVKKIKVTAAAAAAAVLSL